MYRATVFSKSKDVFTKWFFTKNFLTFVADIYFNAVATF